MADPTRRGGDRWEKNDGLRAAPSEGTETPKKKEEENLGFGV